jgi:zinc/manganese transport system substrate-binding protein/manganese/iron transport system substrate-binding protein
VALADDRPQRPDLTSDSEIVFIWCVSRRRVARSPRLSSCLLAAVATVTTPVLAACGSDTAGSADPAGGAGAGAVAVVATTTQAADFARVIGGDRVEVTQILQPNVDPHDYEPSPADIEAIGAADVLVANGVGLEAWLDDTVEASGFDGERVVMAEGVRLRKGGEHAEEEGGGAEAHARVDDAGEHAGGDPHVWHNPRNAKIMVADVERGLSAADPGGKADYEENLDAYTARLDALDRDNERKISTIPAQRRKLVTNHDAFGYYIERYGITFVGSIIPSTDTSAELSGADIDAIVEAIKAQGVSAVFSESSLPPQTAQTIGREANVKIIAGEDALYADTLGPAGSAGATYLDAERHNTDTIVAALT